MLYSSFWVIPRRLNFMCRRFGTLFSIFIGGISRPACEDRTECSEMSAHEIQNVVEFPRIKNTATYCLFLQLRISIPWRWKHQVHMKRWFVGKKPVNGKLKIRKVPDFVLWVCKCVSLTYSVSKEAAISLAAEQNIEHYLYHTNPEPVPSMPTSANRRNMRLFLIGRVQNCLSSFSFCRKKSKWRMNLTNMETGRKEEATEKTAEGKESRKIEK